MRFLLVSPRDAQGNFTGQFTVKETLGISLTNGISDSALRMYHPRMLIVQVHVHVKPDAIDAFKAATVTNAQASRREPGIARFDCLQQGDDPTRFVLIEAYRSGDAPADHKETVHYKTWRDTVSDMLAEPRQSVKFTNIDPPDSAY